MSSEAEWIMVAMVAVVGVFKACEHLTKNGFIVQSPFCSISAGGDSDIPSASASPAIENRTITSPLDPIVLKERLEMI